MHRGAGWCARRQGVQRGEIALAEILSTKLLIAIREHSPFNETQEALERQTATADVSEGDFTNESPTDVQPVSTIAERAAHLTDARALMAGCFLRRRADPCVASAYGVNAQGTRRRGSRFRKAPGVI
jgi:hypothetical protein